MVEQMVTSNLSKYGLGERPSIIATSTTTAEVRDVQNDNKPPVSVEEDHAKNPVPSGNLNRNLVYARRKSDAELVNSDKNRTTSPVHEQQAAGDEKKPDESSAVNSVAPANTTSIRNFEMEQSLSAMEHWKARFDQLHNYLKRCDTSNQDVYLQKLRSFSPDECNRHAVELEKRAIQLNMQEGTEIKRVKELNLLLQLGN